MTKKQFEKLMEALKGIEAALLALRVPNTIYVPQPPYVTEPLPNTVTSPYIGDPIPGSWPIITCGVNSQQANSQQETQHGEV